MKPDTIHDLKPNVRHVRHRHRVTTFEDLSMSLPYDASCAGMTLTFELPGEVDPVYLKDKKGDILFQWQKPPSLSEVREVSQRFL